jgi:hypothetical protein
MGLEEVILDVPHKGVAIVRSGVASPRASSFRSRRPPHTTRPSTLTSVTRAWPNGLFSLFFGAGPGPEHPNTDVLPALLTAATRGCAIAYLESWAPGRARSLSFSVRRVKRVVGVEVWDSLNSVALLYLFVRYN